MSSAALSRSTTPAVRELLKDRAYNELRSRIADGEYEPGAFLAERQLAAELGMSKTPVKAALERLENEGLVTVSPQSGIVVRELSDAEIADIYEIRTVLEGYVVKTIAGHVTAAQMAQWDANLNALERIADQPGPDRRRIVELDDEFHSLPNQFLGNEQILQTMERLSLKNRMVIKRVFSVLPNRASQSLQEHRQIVEAVRIGDGGRAGELMQAHIRRGHEILCNARS